MNYKKALVGKFENEVAEAAQLDLHLDTETGFFSQCAK